MTLLAEYLEHARQFELLAEETKDDARLRRRMLRPNGAPQDVWRSCARRKRRTVAGQTPEQKLEVSGRLPPAFRPATAFRKAKSPVTTRRGKLYGIQC